MLLFLYGGPGDATNPWGYAAFRSWLKYFTVVQWDQRGSERTFRRNGAASASTITPDRMAQDGIELAGWVKKKLHKDKIVLVGHSWGSVLGFLMVKARPELFYAFIGTGQVAAEFARSSAVAYTALVERASCEGNSQVLAELKEVGPPPYKDGRALGSHTSGRTCLKGRTSFWHLPWGSRYTRPGTRSSISTTGLTDRA